MRKTEKHILIREHYYRRDVQRMYVYFLKEKDKKTTA